MKGAAALDVPALSPTEALSFLLLRQFLDPLVPASLLEQLAPYFGMAEQCLAAQETCSPARHWLKKVAVVPAWHALDAQVHVHVAAKTTRVRWVEVHSGVPREQIDNARTWARTKKGGAHGQTFVVAA